MTDSVENGIYPVSGRAMAGDYFVAWLNQALMLLPLVRYA